METLGPKGYAVISSIRRLNDLGLPIDGLLLIFKILLTSLLCYGSSTWGGGHNGIVRRAEIIQNDALRAIFGRRRQDYVADIFERYDLLSLSQAYRIQVALLAFKMSKGIIPTDISFPIAAVEKRTSRRATTFVIN
jgi:hypothetical protein